MSLSKLERYRVLPTFLLAVPAGLGYGVTKWASGKCFDEERLEGPCTKHRVLLKGVEYTFLFMLIAALAYGFNDYQKRYKQGLPLTSI